GDTKSSPPTTGSRSAHRWLPSNGSTGSMMTNVLYVYNAANGTRPATLPMPDTVSSGASIVDGTIYVDHGTSVRGVRAFGLPPPLKTDGLREASARDRPLPTKGRG